MNSLALFKAAPHVYVDHPGTPLEVIGSLILGALYLGLHETPEVFVTHMLRNPGLFMNTAHYFMIVINLVCLCVFFVVSLRPGRWTNIIPAAALSCMYFALHPLALGGSVLWNHNASSFPIGALLLLLLFHHLTTPTSQRKLTASVLIGLGLGSGYWRQPPSIWRPGYSAYLSPSSSTIKSKGCIG